MTFETWAKATSLVDPSITESVSKSMRPSESQSSHLSSAPVRLHNSCQGTRLAWCSALVTTTLSPGPALSLPCSADAPTDGPRPAETFDIA